MRIAEQATGLTNVSGGPPTGKWGTEKNETNEKNEMNEMNREAAIGEVEACNTLLTTVSPLA